MTRAVDPEGSNDPGFDAHEQHALDLAAQLQDRVQRERETVRRLRDYLARTVEGRHRKER